MSLYMHDTQLWRNVSSATTDHDLLSATHKVRPSFRDGGALVETQNENGKKVECHQSVGTFMDTIAEGISMYDVPNKATRVYKLRDGTLDQCESSYLTD